MEHAVIAELLAPFLPAQIPAALLHGVDAYLDLLLRWNSRMNLTAVRRPEQIITRHFGESLFAASHLLARRGVPLSRTVDVGSGAGFPGLPLKLYAPELRLTLVESQHKKATFLREVVRTLRLSDVDVISGRAENLVGGSMQPWELVTMRAVEHFDEVLPVAAALLAGGPPNEREESSHVGAARPRLALLIGLAQAERANQLLPYFRWEPPLAIPQSSARILLVGTRL